MTSQVHAPPTPIPRCAGALLVGVSFVAALPARATDGWEPIAESRGIRVFSRELEGSAHVEFRGVGLVEAPILRLAAVLRNSGREHEWMESCVEARVVEWRSSTGAVIYNRTASPVFFLSDRDLVVEASTQVIAAERILRISFRSVDNPRAPEVAGVVRMPFVRGHWQLRQIDRDTTEVEYKIAADPGGALPGWISRWATESIPMETIDKLRGQAKKPGYEHDEMILERSVDWTGFDLPSQEPPAGGPGPGAARRSGI